MATTGFSDALLVIGATAMRNAIGGLQLHTADPGVGGAANKSSARMVAPAWTVPSGSGNFDLATPAEFTGGAPNGGVAYVSMWSDTTGSGTWYGNELLSGDLTFDSNGAIALESLTQTGSSS